jgi:hypothetical protein
MFPQELDIKCIEFECVCVINLKPDGHCEYIHMYICLYSSLLKMLFLMPFLC